MRIQLIIILIALVLISGNGCELEDTRSQAITQVTITKITDGDTFKLSNGEIVRVLGIDYPDTASDRIGKWTDMGLDITKIKYCYRKGNEYLRNNLVNENATLIADSLEDDKDRYGRILRYVEVDGMDVGEFLIKEGYAVMYDPTKPLCARCYGYARLDKLGGCLWE